MGKICAECEDPSWTGQAPIVAPELPADGGGVKVVDELPEKGQKGMAYVLVDDLDNPTSSQGIFVYDEGWLLTAQPVSEAVQRVTELPDEGQPGVLYYLEKEGEEDTYDLYRWINDEWIKVDTDIKLYTSTGTNTDGAMTQNAVTRMIYSQPSNLSRSGIAIGPNSSAVNGGISIRPGTQQGQTANNGEILIGLVGGTGGGSSQSNIVIGDGGRVYGSSYYNYGNTILGDSATIGDVSTTTIEGAVAIGKNAHASQPGEMNIGSSATRFGYNNSNYRLLTGVYDGQSAHDAATFGQVVSYSAINEAGAPTTATEGKYVGQLYYDTTNEDMYFLKAIDTTTDPVTYTWEGLGGGGSGVKILTASDKNYPANNPSGYALWLLDDGDYYIPFNLGYVYLSQQINNGNANGVFASVRHYEDSGADYAEITTRFGNVVEYFAQVASTGTAMATKEIRALATSAGSSTNQAMTQNAVTSMVFADPQYRNQIKIGNGATIYSGGQNIAIGSSAQTNGDYAISIGRGATATGVGAIALGFNASATHQGEMSIGTSGTYGYNNSNYRLLTGLYDPQSDHDAANKQYVDTAVAGAGASTISSQDWSDLWQ